MNKNAPLSIAISSRALFNLEVENTVFENKDFDCYRAHQHKHENIILKKGAGFPFIKSLLSLNDKAQQTGDDDYIEVIIVSRNTPDLGVRIFKSLEHYGLKIKQTIFTGGAPITPYIKAMDVDLYLSKSRKSIEEATKAGIASSLLYDSPSTTNCDDSIVKIAFDGDAVLFDAESEAIYRKHGLEYFTMHERKNASNHMKDGPLAKFARKLSSLRSRNIILQQSIRLGLFTARSLATHARVLETLRSWNLEMDEAAFLGGNSKTDIVATFGPHLFFDDQDIHLIPASAIVPAGKIMSPLMT